MSCACSEAFRARTASTRTYRSTPRLDKRSLLKQQSKLPIWYSARQMLKSLMKAWDKHYQPTLTIRAQLVDRLQALLNGERPPRSRNQRVVRLDDKTRL